MPPKYIPDDPQSKLDPEQDVRDKAEVVAAAEVLNSLMSTPQKKNENKIKDVFKINYKLESPPRPASVPLQSNSPPCYSPYRYKNKSKIKMNSIVIMYCSLGYLRLEVLLKLNKLVIVLLVVLLMKDMRNFILLHLQKHQKKIIAQNFVSNI